MKLALRLTFDLIGLMLGLLLLYALGTGLWENREMFRWWMPLAGAPMLAAFLWAAWADSPPFVYRLLVGIGVQFVTLALVSRLTS